MKKLKNERPCITCRIRDYYTLGIFGTQNFINHQLLN